MNNNNDGFNIDDVVLTKKQVTSIITKRAKSLFKEDVIKIIGKGYIDDWHKDRLSDFSQNIITKQWSHI